MKNNYAKLTVMSANAFEAASGIRQIQMKVEERVYDPPSWLREELEAAHRLTLKTAIALAEYKHNYKS